MKIRFYIDPETGLPHIYKHDVREVEVEGVLKNQARTVLERKTRG